MVKFLMLIVALLFVVGCASNPPFPPEPKGPVVKVNIQQPHDVYGEPAQ